MVTLNEPVAKRIATLLRMLASNFDGEVLSTVAAMKRLFAAEGLSFHEIASVIESANGEIEEKKVQRRRRQGDLRARHGEGARRTAER